MSWTIYLQSIKNPEMGRKVEVIAESLPKAQEIAVKQNENYKLYGMPEDYFKKD